VELKEERKRIRENGSVVPPFTVVSQPVISMGDTLPFEEPAESLVDNIAIMNSLRKVRSSLIEVQKELSLLEVH